MAGGPRARGHAGDAAPPGPWVAWRGRGPRGQLHVPDPGGRALGGGQSPSSRRAGPGRRRYGQGSATPGVQAPLEPPLCPDPPTASSLHWGCRGFCGPLTTWTGSHAFAIGEPSWGSPLPASGGLALGSVGSLVPQDRPARARPRPGHTQATRGSAGPRGAPRPRAMSPDSRAVRAVTTGPPEAQARPLSQGTSDFAAERLRPKPEAGTRTGWKPQGTGRRGHGGRCEDSGIGRHPRVATGLRAASPELQGSAARAR